MIKLYNVGIFLQPINKDDFVEIECQCGYLLGYANKNDLKPTGKPMFECPKCKDMFDFVLK